jgi:hypothetical protein
MEEVVMIARKLTLLASALVIVSGVATGMAIAKVTSHAREHAFTQQSFQSVLPTSFETDPIVASDASISTYGLDTGHLTDW